MVLAILFGNWSFASAAMLGWFAAISIPLAIHLWSRRRHQEHRWAATQFLMAAMRKHSRRLRLEQLLLLAIRICIIGLMALALADPLWSWSANPQQPSVKGATHFLFVIDTSFSMSYRERDQTLLQMAQDKMKGVMERSGEGDGFSLISMEQSPRVIVNDVLFDRDEVRQHIDQIQISHRPAELTPTLAAVEEVIRRSRERYPRLMSRRVCIFSDVTATTWSGISGLEVQDSLERLTKESELFLFDIGADGLDNYAVASLTANRSIASIGDPVTLTAEVRSFGVSQPATTRLEFLQNGRVVHSEEIPLDGTDRQSVNWSTSFNAAGDQVIGARLTADNLPLDNERWLVVPVKESLNVLCVGGEPEAADFVSIALNPDPANNNSIQSTVISESELSEQDLASFDAVFLCNVGRFTSSEIAGLRSYVEAGGGLVISLGDQVQPDNYNRELRTTGLTTAKLGPIEQGEFFFDPLQYRHSLVAPFRGRERAGLLTVPTWRYFPLSDAPPSSVALAFNSNHPAVVESRVGNGYVVLVATALSPSSIDRSIDPPALWTGLAAWPSFPPLVHGLLQMATRGREPKRSVLVGSSIEFPLQKTDQEVTVSRPDQQRQRADLIHAENRKFASFGETLRSGVYQFEIAGDRPSSRAYAVNLDPRESDLRRMNLASIPAPLRHHNELLIDADSILPIGNQWRLFRLLLMVVGFLMLTEQILAGVFARRAL